MNKKAKLIGVILLGLVISIFIMQNVQAFGVAQVPNVVFNTSLNIGGGNASTSTIQAWTTVGEWELGNTTAFLFGFLYTTNQDVNVSPLTLGCQENWIFTGWTENVTHQIWVLNDSNNCGTEDDKPAESDLLLTFWEPAVAFIYVAAVALYVVFGFTFKDREMNQIGGEDFIGRMIKPLLTSLKALYILTSPAFMLLGIHIAREMAISNSASANIVDALATAFTIFMYLYIFTLLVMLIVLVKIVLSTFVSTTTNSLSSFKNLKEVGNRGRLKPR